MSAEKFKKDICNIVGCDNKGTWYCGRCGKSLVKVYRNGVLLKPNTDYIESPGRITTMSGEAGEVRIVNGDTIIGNVYTSDGDSSVTWWNYSYEE